MEGQGGIDWGIFQDAVLQHIPGSFKGFFRGLEHEFHGAGEGTFVFLQHFCGGEKHGGVEVVAAGMGCGAGLAGKGKPAFLRHGQGIHIRPEEDTFLPAS